MKLRIGGRGRSNSSQPGKPNGPESTSAMLFMPDFSGVQGFRGPRQTGPAVDYTLDLRVTPQPPLPTTPNSSATMPAAVLTSVFGLSTRRSQAAEPRQLDQ